MDLAVVHDFGDALTGRPPNVLAVKALRPVFERAGAEHGVEFGDEFFGVPTARFRFVEAGVFEELLAVDRAHEAREVTIGLDAEEPKPLVVLPPCNC